MDNEDRRNKLENDRKKLFLAYCDRTETTSVGTTLCKDGTYQRIKCKNCASLSLREKERIEKLIQSQRERKRTDEILMFQKTSRR